MPGKRKVRCELASSTPAGRCELQLRTGVTLRMLDCGADGHGDGEATDADAAEVRHRRRDRQKPTAKHEHGCAKNQTRDQMRSFH